MPICSATATEAVMPLPEIQIFGGGAHAGRRVDIQDFMVVAPLATSFDQALEWTAEVYRAAGDDHGRTRSVAGGCRRGRVLAGVRHQRGGARRADAGDRARRVHAGPGDRDLARYRRLGVSRRDGRYRLARDGAELDSRRHGRDADLLARPLSDRLDRGPARRARPRGAAPVHRGGRRPGADRRRRFSRDQRGAGARGGGARAPATRCWSSRTRPAP